MDTQTLKDLRPLAIVLAFLAAALLLTMAYTQQHGPIGTTVTTSVAVVHSTTVEADAECTTLSTEHNYSITDCTN